MIQKKRILSKSGFTLVELLVAVSVLGVLGLVITSVLVQSLKGEKKVQVLNQTKQNAQVVLERIIKDIQGSVSVYCIGDQDPDLTGNHFNADITSAVDTLVLVSIDPVTGGKIYKQYRYINEDTALPGRNGNITFDTVTDPVGGPPSPPLSCNPGSIRPSAQSLTDTDPVNGISLTYDGSVPIFFDNQSPGSPDSVTVKFRANAGISSQALFQTSEQQNGLSGVSFGSTTTIRNDSI